MADLDAADDVGGEDAVAVDHSVIDRLQGGEPVGLDRRRRLGVGVRHRGSLHRRSLGARGQGRWAVSSADHRDRSVPLGKYWHSRPLVFSFAPLCQGLWGSAK